MRVSHCRFPHSLSNPSTIDVQFLLCTAICVISGIAVHRAQQYAGAQSACRGATHWRPRRRGSRRRRASCRFSEFSGGADRCCRVARRHLSGAHSKPSGADDWIDDAANDQRQPRTLIWMRPRSNPFSQSLELLLHIRSPIVPSQVRSDYHYAESTRHRRGSDVTHGFLCSVTSCPPRDKWRNPGFCGVGDGIR
jgi:hypothetical protein